MKAKSIRLHCDNGRTIQLDKHKNTMELAVCQPYRLENIFSAAASKKIQRNRDRYLKIRAWKSIEWRPFTSGSDNRLWKEFFIKKKNTSSTFYYPNEEWDWKKAKGILCDTTTAIQRPSLQSDRETSFFVRCGVLQMNEMHMVDGCWEWQEWTRSRMLTGENVQK